MPNSEPLPHPRRALYPADAEIQFEVVALRRRANFGRTDYWIEPTRGTGEKWTKESALEFLEDEPPEADDE